MSNGERSHLKPACACGGIGGRVIDSRPLSANGRGAIWRRRQCASCGGRFTTYEVVGRSPKEVAREMRALASALEQITHAAEVAEWIARRPT